VTDTAAVLGPGSLGLYGVQLLRVRGVEDVVLTGTRDERLVVGAELGANHTVNDRDVVAPVGVLGERPAAKDVGVVRMCDDS
jgi:threonine dehydrogenase-like Zn-dependent dehydrogenase